ncbi:MAG: DUF488 domain-containing protein [Canibacter sp.]
MSKKNLSLKRAYDDAVKSDGTRVLVDRLWPRGVSKEKAQIDEWIKDIAPSAELRKWYQHDEDKFEEFEKKYQNELKSGEQAEAYKKLKDLVASTKVTLITATKAADISEAAVLEKMLKR